MIVLHVGLAATDLLVLANWGHHSIVRIRRIWGEGVWGGNPIYLARIAARQ